MISLHFKVEELRLRWLSKLSNSTTRQIYSLNPNLLSAPKSVDPYTKVPSSKRHLLYLLHKVLSTN